MPAGSRGRTRALRASFPHRSGSRPRAPRAVRLGAARPASRPRRSGRAGAERDRCRRRARPSRCRARRSHCRSSQAGAAASFFSRSRASSSARSISSRVTGSERRCAGPSRPRRSRPRWARSGRRGLRADVAGEVRNVEQLDHHLGRRRSWAACRRRASGSVRFRWRAAQPSSESVWPTPWMIRSTWLRAPGGLIAADVDRRDQSTRTCPSTSTESRDLDEKVSTIPSGSAPGPLPRICASSAARSP